MSPVSAFGHCFFVFVFVFYARAKKIFVSGGKKLFFKLKRKIKDTEVFLVLLKLRSR